MTISTLFSSGWLLLVMVLHPGPAPAEQHASLRCYAMDRAVDDQVLEQLERERNLARMMTPTPAELASSQAMDREIDTARHRRQAHR